MTIMNMFVCDPSYYVMPQDTIPALITRYEYSTMNCTIEKPIWIQHDLITILSPYRPVLHASYSAQSSLALLLS